MKGNVIKVLLINNPSSFQSHFSTTFLLNLFPDVNECTEVPGRCGLGTCSNNENGMFYECICQNGAMISGSNTDGTLTCIGKSKSLAKVCTCLSLTETHPLSSL